MHVGEFDYDLPAELIAQEPPPTRSGGRLLFVNRGTGAFEDRRIEDLPVLLRAGDLLVVNDTRVFPARLLGHRPSGGAAECLLIRKVETVDAKPDDEGRAEWWEALVHPGQKLKIGARLDFEGDSVTLHADVLERRFFGRRLVRLWTAGPHSVQEAIDAIGHVPLPRYIKRADHPGDRERYQTIFAVRRGSVAAPTAGLHFTSELIETLRARGILTASITLHVGYGTFQPVRVERVEDHRIDAEFYEVGESAARAIRLAVEEGRRVIAVGTTTTRTLESLVRVGDGRIAARCGTTDLFIYPGFEYRIVSGLLTNLHLPKSSLLMMVAAFAGRDAVLTAYRHAVGQRYRFFSYGDAMLVC